MREIYQETVRETSLSINRWVIESIRKKDITKTGCRIFEGGLVGIAGTFGQPSDKDWQEARENLAAGVPYPYPLTEGARRSEDRRQENMDLAAWLGQIEKCLAVCRERYPELVLSNKVNLVDLECRLTNDAGTDLSFSDQFTSIGLLVKKAESANLFDSVIETITRRFDPDQFLKQAGQLLGAMGMKAGLPPMEKPLVIISQGQILSKLREELSGRKIGRKASLLTDKIGRPVFSESFTLYRDVSPEVFGEPFFDMEGTCLPGDKIPLIERGRVVRPYSDKKNAADYGWPLTASAGGGYDDVPTLASGHLSIDKSGLTLKELLGGKMGLYVVIASGGDFTSEGHFAAPVQMAILTDGEKMIGQLPEFSISGSMYDFFGSDFIGVSKDTPFNEEHLVVLQMKVTP
jgi:PmbA protein